MKDTEIVKEFLIEELERAEISLKFASKIYNIKEANKYIALSDRIKYFKDKIEEIEKLEIIRKDQEMLGDWLNENVFKGKIFSNGHEIRV